MSIDVEAVSSIKASRILVTGGAGFIGSHLVDALVDRGKEVQVLDNFSSGRLENLLRSPHLTLIKGDLLDSETVNKAVKGCELVFHLAANPEVRVGSTKPEVHFKQNVVATFRLLEAMRRAESVEGIVFTSSSTVYGDAKKLPTPEDYAPLKPISIYGAAKLASEGLISSYAYTYGFRAVICRLANIVGPRARIGVVRDFIHKLRQNPQRLEILGDGTQSKSYLYVDECVECLALAYAKSSGHVEIFNVGSEDRVNVMDIARIVAEAMGLKGVDFRCTGGVDGGRGWRGDVKYMHLDISRIKALGWKPRRNSAQAIRAAAEALLAKEGGKEPQSITPHSGTLMF